MSRRIGEDVVHKRKYIQLNRVEIGIGGVQFGNLVSKIAIEFVR